MKRRIIFTIQVLLGALLLVAGFGGASALLEAKETAPDSGNEVFLWSSAGLSLCIPIGVFWFFHIFRHERALKAQASKLRSK